MRSASFSDGTLQSKIVRSLDGLSDDNLNYLLDIIERFIKPAKSSVPADRIRKLGTLKPEELYAPDYDIINEDNDIVSMMFGVTEE